MRCCRVVVMAFALSAIVTFAEGYCSHYAVAKELQGTVSGTVVDVQGLPVVKAEITAYDTGGGKLQTVAVNASGAYSFQLPVGLVVIKAVNPLYKSPEAQKVGVLANRSVKSDFKMEAASNFLVEFTDQVDPIPPQNGSWTSPGWADLDNKGYGSSSTVSAKVTGAIDNMPISYAWENRLNLWDPWHTEKCGTVEGDGPSAVVTFSDMMKNFEERVDPLRGTTIAAYDFPDRLGPLTISQDRRGLIAVRVQAKDKHGQEASIHGELHATNRLLGIRNVALGERIYLNRGNDDSSQVWKMTSRPKGSKAELVEPTSRTPYFFPDVAGKYDFSVSGKNLTMYAGKYVGIIAGITKEGNPVPNEDCMTCHDGTEARDQFTSWAKTMHANIFRQDVSYTPLSESYF